MLTMNFVKGLNCAHFSTQTETSQHKNQLCLKSTKRSNIKSPVKHCKGGNSSDFPFATFIFNTKLTAREIKHFKPIRSLRHAAS